jgi:2-oxoglutarate ferredoxin oxidoreductase subunit beta
MITTTYRTAMKPVWCPGCGDYAVLQALTKALQQLEIPPPQVAIFTGIGCSARIAGYVDAYGLNSLHGRSLPLARGAKMFRPELTVFSIGGDGDLFSIGGGHLAHAVRSNLDITCLCFDNFVYGLTKGQTSPTTPLGMGQNPADGVSPVEPVFSVLAYSVGARQSFVAQGISSDPKHLQDLIVQAVRHPGFSFVNVLTSCTTYRKAEFAALKERCVYLDGSHDSSSLMAALELAQTPIKATPHLGVFFRGQAK